MVVTPVDGGVHTTTIKPKTVVNNCWITFRVIWWMIETLTANQHVSTKPYSNQICLQPDIYSTTSKFANIIFILETEWWLIDLFILIYFIVALLLSHHSLSLLYKDAGTLFSIIMWKITKLLNLLDFRSVLILCVTATAVHFYTSGFNICCCQSAQFGL